MVGGAPGWLLKTARLTAFFEGDNLSRQDWWERLVGSPPVEREEKPAEGRWRDFGPFERFGSAHLIVLHQHGRLDWALQPPPSELGQQALTAHCGVDSSAVDSFVEEVRPLLEGLDLQITRLAVAAELVSSGGTLAECNALVAPLVPFEVIPELRDLQVRANLRRPRQVGPGQGGVNRLVRVTVSAYGLFTVNLSPHGVSAEAEGESGVVATLDFDVNTAPGELPPLQGTDAVEVIGDLMRDVSAIIAEGIKAVVA